LKGGNRAGRWEWTFLVIISVYIKAEYELESPDKDDATLAIKDANKIIEVIKEMMQNIF